MPVKARISPQRRFSYKHGMYHDKDILRAYRASREMCRICKNTDAELLEEKEVDTRSLISRIKKFLGLKPVTIRKAYRYCFCCNAKWNYPTTPSKRSLLSFKEWVNDFKVVL